MLEVKEAVNNLETNIKKADINGAKSTKKLQRIGALINGLTHHALSCFHTTDCVNEREVWGTLLERLDNLRKEVMIQLLGTELLGSLDDYEEQIFFLTRARNNDVRFLADELHMLTVKARAGLRFAPENSVFEI